MNNENFISEFCEEILSEIGVTATDEDIFNKIKTTLEDRVNSRLFLEIINLLTPEQAAKLTEELNIKNPEPAKLFERLAVEIPNFQGLVAQILTHLHNELISDLTAIKA
ncbi:MAG: hypothetical protein HY225_03585 [Candidatus Vogelbacteria bacterium]|nr:hypothetical protein [Candidatus Vogelbacteria bacterium]